MPPTSKPLTLILAATPTLGIGKANTLPWPRLPSELAYFARITKRTTSPHPTATNAVIMGRKTWDSIPARLRPLKGRLNVVVSRSGSVEAGDGAEGPVVVGGVEEAVKRAGEAEGVDRVFVIGGASVYGAALELAETRRVLLTKIGEEFECDSFFPVDLAGEGGKEGGWVRASREEFEDFVGEEVVEGGMVEKGVRFEFCMFERR